MQPVIDVEMVIWNGGQVTGPISSFHDYFQSLENAGWKYVASEGLNSTDLAYMQPFFKGYVNYNCDECGLWQDVYTNPFTVLNSWESYYPPSGLPFKMDQKRPLRLASRMASWQAYGPTTEATTRYMPTRFPAAAAHHHIFRC